MGLWSRGDSCDPTCPRHVGRASSWAFTDSFAHWLGSEVNAVNRSALPRPHPEASSPDGRFQPLREEHEALGHPREALEWDLVAGLPGRNKRQCRRCLWANEGLEEGDSGCGWSSRCIDLASSWASGGFSVPPASGRALLRRVQMLRAQTWASLPNSSGRPRELEMWNVWVCNFLSLLSSFLTLSSAQHVFHTWSWGPERWNAGGGSHSELETEARLERRAYCRVWAQLDGLRAFLA